MPSSIKMTAIALLVPLLLATPTVKAADVDASDVDAVACERYSAGEEPPFAACAEPPPALVDECITATYPPPNGPQR